MFWMELVLISGLVTSSVNRAQQSRHYLITEKRPLSEMSCFSHAWMMGNVQEVCYFDNTPSSQTFRCNSEAHIFCSFTVFPAYHGQIMECSKMKLKNSDSEMFL
jgi:hypothetical protein